MEDWFFEGLATPCFLKGLAEGSFELDLQQINRKIPFEGSPVAASHLENFHLWVDATGEVSFVGSSLKEGIGEVSLVGFFCCRKLLTLEDIPFVRFAYTASYLGSSTCSVVFRSTLSGNFHFLLVLQAIEQVPLMESSFAASYWEAFIYLCGFPVGLGFKV